MKICLIGPGIMPIPPDGWGGVEMMIWDYYSVLKEIGEDVDILNIPLKSEIISIVNRKQYDVIHLHYDVFSHIIKNLKAPCKILSSHYPFISEKSRHASDGYSQLIPFIVDTKDHHIFSSSQNDIKTFLEFGADLDHIFLNPLGVNPKSYSFYEKAEYNRTICFSQIVDRKRQFLIQNIDGIDFSGPIVDSKFYNTTNYLGIVQREKLNQEISKYKNFILISSIENATPLAVKEALICGLGIVATKAVAQELDESLDFISIIPEEKIQDEKYIKSTIKKNIEVCEGRRAEIRKYGIDKFGLEGIIKNKYIPKIKELLNK